MKKSEMLRCLYVKALINPEVPHMHPKVREEFVKDIMEEALKLGMMPPEREFIRKRQQTLPGITLLDFTDYENKWDPEE